mgnify:CR=1 FL=1
MKKLSYLIVLTLILGLVLTGCSLLSNVGQVPTSEQSGITYLTKGDFDAECPAAPAVAGLLLEAVGVDNRYGTGRDGGNYIKDVANHMGLETDFDGVDKCDIENYRLAVAKFLIEQGAVEVVVLFQAELESVVYEGTCNKFGTHLGETMTLTFSNNVAIPDDDQAQAMTTVYFRDAYRLGYNDNYMIYTAEGNQVTITVVGTFGGPRPEVGDFVTGLNGIVDALANPVIVPDDGVEVEGIVTYDLVGEWKLDLFIGNTLYKRFIIINTYVSGEITGFLGVGYDTEGKPTGEIIGTVVSKSISMLYDRTGYVPNPAYTAQFEGIIDDCDYISGTWSDYARTDEPWEMYRLYY